MASSIWTSVRCSSAKFSVARSCGYASATAKKPRRATDTLRRSCPRRGYGASARLRHPFERLPFETRRPFHGFDHVRDEIVTSFELNVDVRPGVVGLHVQADETVVDHHDRHDDDRQYRDEDSCHG